MSTTTKTTRPAAPLKRGSTDPVHYRLEADYSIVRIIACRIAWLTSTNQWTNEPHRRARYTEREAAYGVAQACRGLLVIGCGLVDYSDPLTQ